MYVAEIAAGQGIGRHLLRAAVARSKSDFVSVEQLNLTVLAANDVAKRLYQSEGFILFAREPDALRDATGKYHDEEQLRLPLNNVPR